MRGHKSVNAPTGRQRALSLGTRLRTGNWEASGKKWQLPFVGGDLPCSERGFKKQSSAETLISVALSGFAAPVIRTFKPGEHGEEREHRQFGLEALLLPTAKC